MPLLSPGQGSHSASNPIFVFIGLAKLENIQIVSYTTRKQVDLWTELNIGMNFILLANR